MKYNFLSILDDKLCAHAPGLVGIQSSRCDKQSPALKNGRKL